MNHETHHGGSSSNRAPPIDPTAEATINPRHCWRCTAQCRNYCPRAGEGKPGIMLLKHAAMSPPSRAALFTLLLWEILRPREGINSSTVLCFQALAGWLPGAEAVRRGAALDEGIPETTQGGSARSKDQDSLL